MLYKREITTDRLVLKNLKMHDCNEQYLNWLNDKEVNRFLEIRWYLQTIEGTKSFVDEINRSDHSYLFGIFYRETEKKESDSRKNGGGECGGDMVHIGNIKIGPINKLYSYADISYFIGNKDYWGVGLATEAIKAVLKFGFEIIGLNRIQAGVFGKNAGSIKALEKAGFMLEGNFRRQLCTKDFCDDGLHYGILKDEWLENNK